MTGRNGPDPRGDDRRRIALLDATTVSKIAAGEVIVSPAGAVKELVENALDAGARTLTVSVTAGGTREIRVRDDGCGMTRDEALLALERHATSKIRSSDDLARVRTYGFRGEALPSIAAVSRFRIRTRIAAAAGGSEIEVEEGRPIATRDVAAPVGTEVVARDLFHNVPVRRKFLKTPSGEYLAVIDIVTRYALAHPEVSVRLEHGPKLAFQTGGLGDLRSAIATLFGPDLLGSLLEIGSEGAGEGDRAVEATAVEDGDSGFGLTGFVSRPEACRGSNRHLHFFVNRRPVRVRSLQHAVLDAYRDLIGPDRYPVGFLFFELPTETVDVNIHPTKSEVAFQAERALYAFLRRAIRDALERARLVPRIDLGVPGMPPRWIGARAAASPSEGVRPVNADAEGMHTESVHTPGVLPGGEAAPQHRPGPLPPASPEDPGPALAFESRPLESPVPVGSSRDYRVTPGLDPARVDRLGLGPPSRSASPFLDKYDASTRPVGRLYDTFILVQDRRGLFIVDQHVASERIQFDAAVRMAKGGEILAQGLLVPVVVEFGASDLARLDAGSDLLRKVGFSLEPWGERAFAVTAVPALLASAADGVAIRKGVEAVLADREPKTLEDALHRLYSTRACKSAIKAGDPLSAEQAEHLISELLSSPDPYRCPHGRPVLHLIPAHEILRKFDRI